MELFNTYPTKIPNLCGVNNPDDMAIYTAQEGRCFECHKPVQFFSASDERPEGYTVEHVFPSSLGFGLYGNKVLSCLTCNRRKAQKLPSKQYLGAVQDLYRKVFPKPAIDAMRSVCHPVWAGRRGGRGANGALRMAH